jgi:hypothetical protein
VRGNGPRQQCDRDGYRRTCAALLRRPVAASDTAAQEAVRLACLLGPDAVPAWGRVPEWLRPLPPANGNDEGFAVFCRAGRCDVDTARRWDKDIAERLKMGPIPMTYQTMLFLAMAHHRLGETEEACKWLARAGLTNRWGADQPWWKQLEDELLLCEAWGLILGGTVGPMK